MKRRFVDPGKAQLERELLAAQKEKVAAEVEMLRRTTPLTETIKVAGSMVLGIGGAVAAVAGFQLAEVKAEKLKHEAALAEGNLQRVKAEVHDLNLSRDAAQRTLAELKARGASSQKELAGLADELTALRERAQTQQQAAKLQDLEQKVSALDIDLRAGAIPAARPSGGSLDTLIQNLFGPTAAIRGAAYDELLSRFAGDPELVPKLLAHAQANPQNHNGVYNTLVVFNRLEPRVLKAEAPAIRALAERSRAIGPKTSDRVDKLLARLPA